MLRKEGVQVNGNLYDTMIAAHLLNPNKPNHSLEDTALEYLAHKKKAFNEVLGKRRSFAEVPVDEATNYAAEDAELAFELKNVLFQKLREEGLENIYTSIEMPLISVLADMEETGIKIDHATLNILSKELETDVQLLEQKIYSLAGGEFNINSPKQLSKVLFENLKLTPSKKTKTGYSTGMDVLEDLARSHALPAEILNYRTLFKLKTTYVDALPVLINQKTGRIHTSFNQTVTATGRLSSSDPNLQNIPVRGIWGTKIRRTFIAEQGFVLLSADYSQIELRILAHLSNDTGLIEAFRKDIDIHTQTASDLFGIPPGEITKDMRRMAKTVNFGIIYGISPFGLSETLNIAPKEAGAYIEQYFAGHENVRRFLERTVSEARRQGYVATLAGRKRPIPEINSSNATLRQQAERMAINSPIQGSAADLIKTAMIAIWRRLKKSKLKTRLLLQIHDELLLEVPGHELEEVKTLVQDEMENAMILSVPVKAGIGYGENWAEAH
jgi:DNA polymerase-1